MKSIHIDNINDTYNFAILSNKTIEFMNINYHLSARMMTEDDTISAMGYQILDALDLKIKNLVEKINKSKLEICSEEIVFYIMYELLEDSKIYTLEQGKVESIINKLNKSSYAFYPCNTFEEFLKYNELHFYIIKEDLLRIIDDKNSNTNTILIELYNKFKNKEYEYLDEFIKFIKDMKNEYIKKEVKK